MFLFLSLLNKNFRKHLDGLGYPAPRTISKLNDQVMFCVFSLDIEDELVLGFHFLESSTQICEFDL